MFRARFVYDDAWRMKFFEQLTLLRHLRHPEPLDVLAWEGGAKHG